MNLSLQSKFLYNMKALVDPTSTQNRRVLSDNYGVTLPALVDKKASKVCPDIRGWKEGSGGRGGPGTFLLIMFCD